MDRELAEVTAQIDPQTGDTLVDGRTLAQVLEDTPSPYLATAEWSVDGTVVFNGHRLVRYGVPRVRSAAELVRVGEFQGVPLFAERDDEPDEYGRIITFYLPIRPGCEFQIFMDETDVGPVRGRR